MRKQKLEENPKERILFWWVAFHMSIYPISGLISMMFSFVVFSLIFVLSTLAGNPPEVFRTMVQEYNFLLIPTVAVSAAFVFGFMQKYLFKRYLYWTADRWRRTSVLGGLISGLVLMVLWLVFRETLEPALERREGIGYLYYILPFFLFFVSLFQWHALRDSVFNAWLWVVANVIGGMVFATIFNVAIISDDSSSTNTTVCLFALAAPVLQAIITGRVFFWIFERCNRLSKSTQTVDEVIPQKSIWDEAI
jgi:hypothetical protein